MAWLHGEQGTGPAPRNSNGDMRECIPFCCAAKPTIALIRTWRETPQLRRHLRRNGGRNKNVNKRMG